MLLSLVEKHWLLVGSPLSTCDARELIPLEVGACAAAGKLPPPGWTAPDESAPKVNLKEVAKRDSCKRLKYLLAHKRLLLTQSKAPGTRHSIGLPLHIYPLYENALRAHRNQSIQDNDVESAHLYASFAKVAEQNPLACSYGQPAATAKTISSVTKTNRMICFPCSYILC